MTVTWWISSNKSSIQCLWISLILFLLSYHCYRYHCTCYKKYYFHCYRYYSCCHYYQNYHTTLLLITLLQIINLQVWLNWQLSCYYLQIFFGSPCVESINLGWILHPRKLLRSHILVDYQDLFLAPSIAIFVESLGIIIILSLWRIWRIQRLWFIPLRRGEVRNCHPVLL